jgi:adenylate cyclase
VRTKRQQRLRDALFLAVGLGAVGLALVSYGLGFLNNFERQSVDARFSIRGMRGAPKNLLIVAIDPETFSKFPDFQWPYKRADEGLVIDRAAAGGAKAIAVDIQYSEYSRFGNADDNALYVDLQKARGKVVLATTEVAHPKGRPPLPNSIFNQVFKQIGARYGNGNFRTDNDGVDRKVAYRIDGIKTLSVATAEVALGHAIKASQLGGSEAWIDYAGPPRTVTTIPFWQVLCAPPRPKTCRREQAFGGYPAGIFKGKIVVIGSTAPVLQDIHASPFGSGMPGPEVQANAIETAFHGYPLKSVPSWLNILVIVLLGLAPVAVAIRLSPVVAVAASILLAGLFAVATQLAFNSGWIDSFVYPLVGLTIAAVGSIVNHYVVAAFERERVRDVFSRFVPETVVDQVLAQAGGDLRLGGSETTATVMFSDLRGFTSSAEHMSANAVIDVLNHYLGEMTDAILDHGGTLLSFMGDGIYAMFGAPISQEDHADRALAAARDMLEVRLPKFNEWMRDAGLGEGYRMGIGLNTGSIMSGNVGHERRVEYTAVGDTVNTASRIEGMTKGTPYMLFVSETTYSLLREPTEELVYWDEVEIRGRKQKLKLWGFEPAGVETPAPAVAAAPAPA